MPRAMTFERSILQRLMQWAFALIPGRAHPNVALLIFRQDHRHMLPTEFRTGTVHELQRRLDAAVVKNIA
jgi:hypothetical protein